MIDLVKPPKSPFADCRLMSSRSPAALLAFCIGSEAIWPSLPECCNYSCVKGWVSSGGSSGGAGVTGTRSKAVGVRFQRAGGSFQLNGDAERRRIGASLGRQSNGRRHFS